MSKKLFITFEGPDGSGKTTAIKIVNQILSKDRNVILTREPGGTGLSFSEQIRKIIFENKDIDVLTELFLFEAARREHIKKVIEPNLKKGNTILCDRFIDSSMVYQGIVGKVNTKIVSTLNEIAISKFTPDITFIFDIESKLAIERLSNNNRENQTNKFDLKKIDYHKKVRNAYLKLAKTEKRFVLIKITKEKTPQDIANEVVKIINEKRTK